MKLIVLFLVIGTTCYQSVMAQKPGYKFKAISQPDGLINSTIQTIFEDSYGFIWLGTHHGIQRYDGKTYKNYFHTDLDSTGLSKNFLSR